MMTPEELARLLDNLSAPDVTEFNEDLYNELQYLRKILSRKGIVVERWIEILEARCKHTNTYVNESREYRILRCSFCGKLIKSELKNYNG